MLEAADLPLLLDPGRAGGLDLLGFLHEAGFAADVVAPPGADAALLQRVSAMLERGDLLQLEDEAQWLEAAGSGRYHAVLSNLAVDARHQALGLGRFSLFDFEIGLQGALASVERILHACSMGFYRKYREYLGP